MDTEDLFVTAMNTATKEKQRIPAHWLGHPTLGANFKELKSGTLSSETATATDTITRN